MSSPEKFAWIHIEEERVNYYMISKKKMEVARVQLQILETMNSLRGSIPEAAAAISQLNADLIDLTQLYSDFAEPFSLWECQLSIIHCAGHPDTNLIEVLWNNVLDLEISKVQQNVQAQTKISVLSSKLKSLGKLYASSQKYFPMEFIVKKLELFSLQINGDYEWVFKSLLSIGMALPKVFEVYNKLYTANDPVWLTKGAPYHLLRVLAKLSEKFAESPSNVPSNERRHFTVYCLDVIGNCLGYLYTKHDTKDLVSEFRAIQAKLERL